MNNSIYLVQTDTTVGFLSKSSSKLFLIKQRPINKQILQNTSSFKVLKQYTRVPNKYKKLVRNSSKTSFIYPNNLGIRVVKNTNFNKFLDKFDILYSTSANLSNHKYQKSFAYKNADIIVNTNISFTDSTPSKLFRLTKNKMIKLR